jgi:hypothetical protein
LLWVAVVVDLVLLGKLVGQAVGAVGVQLLETIMFLVHKGKVVLAETQVQMPLVVV